MPILISDGLLINFEKRRKEFDIIAQLKLFQSAARSYHFKMDPKFCSWFQLLPCLPEKDWYAVWAFICSHSDIPDTKGDSKSVRYIRISGISESGISEFYCIGM